jgi:hypothetical protein
MGRYPLTRLGAMLALGASLSLATACSPYIYKREISALATNVETMSTAHDAGLAGARALRLAEQRRDWIENRTHLDTTAACSPTPGALAPPADEETCELRRADGSAASPSDTEIAARRTQAHIDALVAYVAALQAITNAEDRAAFDEASAELTKTIAELSDDAAAPRIEAAGGFLSSVFGAYLDRRRLQALRSGVNAAHPAISDLSLVLATSLDALRLEQARLRNRHAAELLTAIEADGLDAEAYTALLTELEAETNALEALNRARPRRAGQGLVAAHLALKNALADDRRQSTAVFEAIQQFAEEVQKVEDAFD